MRIETTIKDVLKSLDWYQKENVPLALEEAVKSTMKLGKKTYKKEYLKAFNLKDRKLLNKAVKAHSKKEIKWDGSLGYSGAITIKSDYINLSKYINIPALKSHLIQANRGKLKRKKTDKRFISIKTEKMDRPIRLKKGFASFVGKGTHFGIFKRRHKERYPIVEYVGPGPTALEHKKKLNPIYRKQVEENLHNHLNDEFLNNLKGLI